MKVLIVVFAALCVSLFLIIMDLANRTADARSNYTRASDLYRGTFGDSYLSWFKKSRRTYRYYILVVVMAFASLVVCFIYFGYFLFTYLISK